MNRERTPGARESKDCSSWDPKSTKTSTRRTKNRRTPGEYLSGIGTLREDYFYRGFRLLLPSSHVSFHGWLTVRDSMTSSVCLYVCVWIKWLPSSGFLTLDLSSLAKQTFPLNFSFSHYFRLCNRYFFYEHRILEFFMQRSLLVELWKLYDWASKSWGLEVKVHGH